MSTLMAGLLGRVSAQDSVGISEMIMRARGWLWSFNLCTQYGYDCLTFYVCGFHRVEAEYG